jgi:hypothetical protein
MYFSVFIYIHDVDIAVPLDLDVRIVGSPIFVGCNFFLFLHPLLFFYIFDWNQKHYCIFWDVILSS